MALAVVFGIALWAYISYVKHEARATVVAELQQATAAETARRQAVLETVQAQAQQTVAKLAASENNNAKLLSEIRRLSAAHDNAPCLDGDAAARLQSIH